MQVVFRIIINFSEGKDVISEWVKQINKNVFCFVFGGIRLCIYKKIYFKWYLFVYDVEQI